MTTPLKQEDKQKKPSRNFFDLSPKKQKAIVDKSAKEANEMQRNIKPSEQEEVIDDNICECKCHGFPYYEGIDGKICNHCQPPHTPTQLKVVGGGGSGKGRDGGIKLLSPQPKWEQEWKGFLKWVNWLSPWNLYYPRDWQKPLEERRLSMAVQDQLNKLLSQAIQKAVEETVEEIDSNLKPYAIQEKEIVTYRVIKSEDWEKLIDDIIKSPKKT